jgi:hypothetical protein
MNNFINTQYACPQGLALVSEQVLGFFDNRKTMELRTAEKKHMAECPICNPALLAGQLFGQPVIILEEVEHAR